jgi:hypothetical protein
MNRLRDNATLRWIAVLPAAVLGNVVAVLAVGIFFLLMPQDSVYRLLGAFLGWMTQAPTTEDMAQNFVLEPIRAYTIVVFGANTAPAYRRTTAICLAAAFFALSAFIVGLNWSTLAKVFVGGFWGLAAYIIIVYGLVVVALVLAVRHVSQANDERSYLTSPAEPPRGVSSP